MSDRLPAIIIAFAATDDPEGTAAALGARERFIGAHGGTTLAHAPANATQLLEGDRPADEAVLVATVPSLAAAREMVASAGYRNAPRMERVTRSYVMVAMPLREGGPAQGGAYLVVRGQVTDRDKLGIYNQTLPPIYAAHGGAYMALGRPDMVTVLEGGWDPQSLVVAAFPDVGAGHGFWHSDAYTRAKTLRAGAGRFRVLLVPSAD